MERDYEKKMIHVFGERMRLVFELDRDSLPTPMVHTLERLHHVELQRAAERQGEPARDVSDAERANSGEEGR